MPKTNKTSQKNISGIFMGTLLILGCFLVVFTLTSVAAVSYDVNGDGAADITDLAVLGKCLSGDAQDNIPVGPKTPAQGALYGCPGIDINANGIGDANDAQALVAHLYGWTEPPRGGWPLTWFSTVPVPSPTVTTSPTPTATVSPTPTPTATTSPSPTSSPYDGSY